MKGKSKRPVSQRDGNAGLRKFCNNKLAQQVEFIGQSIEVVNET
jgi:hypothetical protein